MSIVVISLLMLAWAWEATRRIQDNERAARRIHELQMESEFFADLALEPAASVWQPSDVPASDEAARYGNVVSLLAVKSARTGGSAA